MDAFWIILTGTLVAASGAMLGSYLVLRKLSMVADAISHAVLPGIAAAYLITGSINSLPMVLGAATCGILTTFLIQWIHNKARLQTDASIGLVFTFLFAVGIIMVTSLAGNVDLDQQCVLYGEIGYVIFEKQLLGMPVSTFLLLCNTLLILLLITVGNRGLFLTSFDPAYAAALGISTGLWHYLLMSAVSLTAVVSFESVGAILVVAFLIAPASTAYLITNRLRSMLWLSVLLGAIASAGGYGLAVIFNSTIAGAMTVVLGLEFAIALAWVLFTKEYGRKIKSPAEQQLGGSFSGIESSPDSE